MEKVPSVKEKAMPETARRSQVSSAEWTIRDSCAMPHDLVAHLRRGEAMTKDEDYFRELMLELEAADDWVHYIPLDEEDSASEKRYYHALMLADAGALEVSGRGSDHFRIRDQGYTLIAVMRDGNAWGKVKSSAKAAGGYGARALLAAAEAYAIAQVKQHLGLPP